MTCQLRAITEHGGEATVALLLRGLLHQALGAGFYPSADVELMASVSKLASLVVLLAWTGEAFPGNSKVASFRVTRPRLSLPSLTL